MAVDSLSKVCTEKCVIRTSCSWWTDMCDTKRHAGRASQDWPACAGVSGSISFAPGWHPGDRNSRLVWSLKWLGLLPHRPSAHHFWLSPRIRLGKSCPLVASYVFYETRIKNLNPARQTGRGHSQYPSIRKWPVCIPYMPSSSNATHGEQAQTDGQQQCESCPAS